MLYILVLWEEVTIHILDSECPNIAVVGDYTLTKVSKERLTPAHVTKRKPARDLISLIPHTAPPLHQGLQSTENHMQSENPERKCILGESAMKLSVQRISRQKNNLEKDLQVFVAPGTLAVRYGVFEALSVNPLTSIALEADFFCFRRPN